MRLNDVLAWLVSWLSERTFLLHADVFAVSTTSVHGRMAVRAFAYSIAAQEPEIARILLDRVGREG